MVLSNDTTNQPSKSENPNSEIQVYLIHQSKLVGGAGKIGILNLVQQNMDLKIQSEFHIHSQLKTSASARCPSITETAFASNS